MSTYKISPLDAEILLSHTLRKSKEFLFTHTEKKLTKTQTEKMKSLFARRSGGEPIAYITSQKEFYGLDFFVDKNVLIPRPETEIMTEKILNRIRDTGYEIRDTNIIDIGTGSGNIIISIAKNIPDKIFQKFSFYGVDISKKSLQTAKKNARKNNVGGKIKFIRSDLLEYFIKHKKIFGKNNCIIAANLPYVSPSLYKKYSAGLYHEPKTALISKMNGLGHYIRLFSEIKNIIQIANCRSLISLFIEISPEQKKPISRLISGKFPGAKINFHKDFAGKNRIAEISFVGS